MIILTPEEAETLAEARAILRELAHGFGRNGEARSIQERAADQIAEDGWRRDSDMMDVGRVTALAEKAEDGIFNLINTLSNHCGDEAAAAIINRWHPREQEPSEPEYVPTARQEKLEEMGEEPF